MIEKAGFSALRYTGLLLVVLCCRVGGAEQAESTEFVQVPNLTGQRGGNLVASVNADLPTFNRMLTAGLAHVTVLDRISADLVHFNRITFELEPSLAARWEADKEGRSYTIHLRRGVRFSDGSPFTADDVVFTCQVIQDPKTEAVQVGQMQIDGGFPIVSKIDAHTIRVTFPRPVGMGLRLFDSIPILPGSILARAYQEGKLPAAWGPTASPNVIVGLGPFRLKEYQRGTRVVLERNPYYWKKDKSGQTLPYLDTITFLIVPDRNAEALRFQTGEIDLLNSMNSENYASLRRYQAQRNFTLRDLGPGLAVDFLWFNLNTSDASSGKVDPEKRLLFESAEFRRAVSYALDRDGMTRSIWLGLGTPQHGPISSGNKAWYDGQLPRTEYNPDRAKESLARLGLKDTDGDGVLEFGARRRPLEIVLSTARGNVAREKTAQVIKDNLLKVGIRVHVQLVLPNELAARFLDSFDYEAVLFGLTPTDVVPDLQTDLWYSSGSFHFWHPKQSKPQRSWEAEIDSLTSRLVRSIDPLSRKKDFYRIQEIWAREMPAIPTLASNILVGWHKSVGNVRPSILVPHLLWNAEELTKAR